MNRPSQAAESPWQAEDFQAYLLVLARSALRGFHRVGQRIEDVDVVQETMLQAKEKRHQFRGQSVGEFKVWLKAILLSRIQEADNKLHAKKRDVRREHSLEQAMQESGARLEQWAPQVLSTPSAKVQGAEHNEAVYQALAQLTQDELAVIDCHYWRNQESANSIAEALHLPAERVRDLLTQARKKLRQALLPVRRKLLGKSHERRPRT